MRAKPLSRLGAIVQPKGTEPRETLLQRGGPIRCSTDMARRIGENLRKVTIGPIARDCTFTFDVYENGVLVRLVGCTLVVDLKMDNGTLQLPDGRVISMPERRRR